MLRYNSKQLLNVHDLVFAKLNARLLERLIALLPFNMVLWYLNDRDRTKKRVEKWMEDVSDQRQLPEGQIQQNLFRLL